jgi:1-deoxy-D-xylulose-5-phosphate reductoisomerase
MHMPISFALMYPHRAQRDEHFSFADNPTLTFAEVDRVKYPALDIAYNCLRAGGTAACTMNGANEVAVAAFLDHKCGYLDIVRTIEYALNRAENYLNPTLEHYVAADLESRHLAREFLKIKE